MPAVALGIYVAFVVIAFGVRAGVHYRRTGDYGLRGLARGRASEWVASTFLVMGLTLAGAAPIAELLGLIASSALQAAWLHGTGLVLALFGMAVTVISQYQMGDSWRVGVDTQETTTLMTAGLFTVVRNPIFTGTLIATAGLVMMLPNRISTTAAVCVFAGLEMQVRWIEEPYLAQVHGDRYRSYASRVGRFLPRVGRMS